MYGTLTIKLINDVNRIKHLYNDFLNNLDPNTVNCYYDIIAKIYNELINTYDNFLISAKEIINSVHYKNPSKALKLYKKTRKLANIFLKKIIRIP